MARKSVRFALSEEEVSTLKMWVGGHKTEQGLSRRAQVILCFRRGLNPQGDYRSERAERNECSQMEKAVSVRQSRWPQGQTAIWSTLYHNPWERANVMSLACQKPFTGANAWSRRELARVTGVSSTTVHRILTEASIKPHKIHHWCGKSPDPEFEPKQAAIIGLYMAPPENAVVLSVTRNLRFKPWIGHNRCFRFYRATRKGIRQPTLAMVRRACSLHWPCMKAQLRPNA